MTERDEKRMQMWKIFRTHSVKIFVTIRPKPKSRKKLCKINVSNQQDCQKPQTQKGLTDSLQPVFHKNYK